MDKYQSAELVKRLEEDIEMIYSKPDIEFLNEKKNKKYIECICLETDWFFRYVTELSNSYKGEFNWE